MWVRKCGRMERLRRVFVERYIGLVMVCVFLYQALVMAGRVLQYPFGNLVVWIYNASRPRDTFELPEPGRSVDWFSVMQLLYSLMPLLLAVFTYRWVYARRASVATPPEGSKPEGS